MSDQPEVPTPLSDHDRVRLYRAFGAMPYLGGSMALVRMYNHKPATVDDVLSVLDELRQRLEDAATRAQGNKEALWQLRGTVAGGARFLKLLMAETGLFDDGKTSDEGQ